MTRLNHLVLALVIGAAPIAYAQDQPAEPQTADPSSASSPHQRQATGQSGTAEAPASENQGPSSAASPHQHEAVGEGATSGKKMASAPNASDPASFVKKAALGGMTEVEASKLAVSKAQDPQVRAFAQKMVKEHTAANEELTSLAQKKGWNVPSSLDSEHKAIVQKLSSKSGEAFDTAYAKQMLEDHEKTVALFKAATRSSDADLAAWVEKTLPTIEQHEQMAATLPGASRSASASKNPQKQY
jgi:putative membrane protein